MMIIENCAFMKVIEPFQIKQVLNLSWILFIKFDLGDAILMMKNANQVK